MNNTDNWVQRFDVAKILEENIDLSYWKGDEQTKGVFFTDDYGYTLNKVLAIRVKHNEQAPEVFYSFTASCEEDVVVTEYPFKDLEIKPKNHHLLFDTLQLKKTDLNTIFDTPYTYEEIKIDIAPLKKLLESVQNKRERERSFLQFEIREGVGEFKIVRKQKKERIVTFSDIIQCEKITPGDVIRAQKQTFDVEHLKKTNPTEEKGIKGAINAHSLHYLLKIFSSLDSILFRFSRDRIMITGDKQEVDKKKLPNVEAILALNKNI